MAYLQIANSRAGKCLVYEKYRYVRNKVRNDCIYWRCAEKGCSVFIKTNYVNVEDNGAPNIQILSGPREHGHGDQGSLVATNALVEELIGTVAAEPSRPSKRVYDEVSSYFIMN